MEDEAWCRLGILIAGAAGNGVTEGSAEAQPSGVDIAVVILGCAVDMEGSALGLLSVKAEGDEDQGKGS
jgi:hypothetical protein